MLDHYTAREQSVRDERTVAAPRNRLGAHDRHRSLLRERAKLA
jgi:hypothetical protein